MADQQQQQMLLDQTAPPQQADPQQQAPQPDQALAQWMQQATGALTHLLAAAQGPPTTTPNVTLPNFHGRTDENVTTFLYQLDQVFVARRVPEGAHWIHHRSPKRKRPDLDPKSIGKRSNLG